MYYKNYNKYFHSSDGEDAGGKVFVKEKYNILVTNIDI